MQLDIGDRAEAQRLAQVRQAWQGEAWVYRRTLGELRYAVKYLGNSCMRLRLFAGVRMPGATTPVELSETQDHGLPSDLVAAAEEAMTELGNGGPIGVQNLVRRLTENFQVAGECYLVGRQENMAADPVWRIHSVSEVAVERDGRIGVKETPGSNQKDVNWLDPDRDYISRLWTPDPQWGMLADSPVGGVLDICEELLLVGRDVRATVRSRLANNGLLLIPDGLSILGPEPEEDTDEGDAFFSELIRAAEAAISNEGEAAAAVPLVVRGPSEGLDKIRHIVLDRPQNQFNVTQRAELIGRLATGLDLPSEVLTGKVDLNHWTAWQVDDDTFRHHVEPIAIEEVDALTVGYLWKRLDAMQRWDPALVRRLVIWYDPTELVTHPDRTQDGLQLWDRVAISDDTLRRIAGFTEADAPGDKEKLLRIALRLRSLDPSIQGQILKDLDPAIVPPPPKTGSGGGGTGAPPAPANPPSLPGPPAGASAQRNADLHARLQRALTAAAAKPEPTPETRRTAQRLLDIDRRLRDKLHAAANTSVRRALERAGAKVISKARTASAAPIREMIRDVPPALVPATLGTRLVASLGFTEQQLLDTEFADLRKQYDEWVRTGQTQAIREVAKLAGVDMNAVITQLGGTFKDNRDEGWRWLQAAMQRAAEKLLADLQAFDTGAEELVVANLVPVGDVRASLALAGGFGSDGQSSGLDDNGFPVDPNEMMGQIGTGSTVTQFLADNGFSREGFEWVHGASANPFQPHLDLDGHVYTNFDDPSNSTGDNTFPPGGYYYPGDHNGCSCDFMPIIVPAVGAGTSEAA